MSNLNSITMILVIVIFMQQIFQYTVKRTFG